jgi:hypothetical protein
VEVTPEVADGVRSIATPADMSETPNRNPTANLRLNPRRARGSLVALSPGEFALDQSACACIEIFSSLLLAPTWDLIRRYNARKT